MEKSLVALTVLTLVCLVPARAQNSAACTPASLRGTYSVTCSGVSSPAPGAPQMPFSGLGIIKYDWGGNYSASFKVSLGGVFLSPDPRSHRDWALASI